MEKKNYETGWDCEAFIQTEEDKKITHMNLGTCLANVTLVNPDNCRPKECKRLERYQRLQHYKINKMKETK